VIKRGTWPFRESRKGKIFGITSSNKLRHQKRWCEKPSNTGNRGKKTQRKSNVLWEEQSGNITAGWPRPGYNDRKVSEQKKPMKGPLFNREFQEKPSIGVEGQSLRTHFWRVGSFRTISPHHLCAICYGRDSSTWEINRSQLGKRHTTIGGGKRRTHGQ